MDRSSYYVKKHAVLEQIIRERITFPDDLESVVLKVCPTFQTSAWNYFGRLFAYNTLEYWSEA